MNLKQPKIIYKGKDKLIWQLPCIAHGAWNHSCGEGADQCHVTTGSFAGANLKNDRRIIPMCRVHHSIQHTKPEAVYYKNVFRYGIHDATELADLLHIIYLEGELGLIEDPLRAMYEACERFSK